jgi:hypothetical protein
MGRFQLLNRCSPPAPSSTFSPGAGKDDRCSPG